MMAAVYREILDELVRRGFPIARPARSGCPARARRGAALRALVRSRWPA